MDPSPSKLRHRTLFLGIGAVTTVFSLVLLHFARTTAAHRAPAALAEPAPLNAGPNEEPAICKDFYKVICHRPEQARRDPTGMVRPDVEGERIVADMDKQLIEQHSDWSPEQVDQELVHEIFTPVRRGRIEVAFHWVQSRMEHLIDVQPETVFNAAEKKRLKQRVHRTTLDIPPPYTAYSDEPDLLTKNDVFYERTSDGLMRMRVGGAYLFTAKSWFNMIFTMGHELGHSIDPCEIRSAGLAFPAYDRLEACFFRTGLVQITHDRTECGENDQLSEAFADWIGAQIAAEALKTFSNEFHGSQLVNAVANTVRDLCSQDGDDELDMSDHPSPRIRIDRIFGSQPEIRQILGCSSSPVFESPSLLSSAHCSFDPDLPSLQKRDP